MHQGLSLERRLATRCSNIERVLRLLILAASLSARGSTSRRTRVVVAIAAHKAPSWGLVVALCHVGDDWPACLDVDLVLALVGLLVDFKRLLSINETLPLPSMMAFRLRRCAFRLSARLVIDLACLFDGMLRQVDGIGLRRKHQVFVDGAMLDPSDADPFLQLGILTVVPAARLAGIA